MERRTKRSAAALTALAGFSVLTLASCEDNRSDAQAFETQAQCEQEAAKEGSLWTPEACASAFAEALAAHAQTAPRYDAIEVCEEQHGAGACATDAYRSDGGSIFMPLMAGYLMGQVLNGKSQPAVSAATPLYPAKSGGFFTANGGTRLSALTGTTRVSTAAFKPAAQTITAKPMTRATVTSRGGFGASRTSFGGARFGG